ncbi:MAG: hypothetical protein JXE06_07900 [Coriobacteriia bacterium]|nr:hypothetical protein [Coriobacteriia bacterium]MBN2822308.1 hypothetical protein [Coriobacteriia bacterium]
MNRLSQKLYSLSSGWMVLAALGLFALFIVVVLPAQAEVSEQELSGLGSPDTSLFYSADDIYDWAEAYGVDGRDAYVRARWTFDLAWPVAYGLFLVTAIGWTGKFVYPVGSRGRLLNLVPLVAVLLDYTENVLTSMVILAYPRESIVAATLVPSVSAVKWAFVTGSFFALLGGLLALSWNRVRG